MSFDPAWETGYAAETVGLGGNPQLVHLFDSFCNGHQDRVLELGCGVGFNIQHWLGKHADYYAVDGSKTAIKFVHRIWPYLRERVLCHDFTCGLPFTGFDVVFDRAAIAHNCETDIRAAVRHAYDALKPGGIFVSCDWFSDKHTELQNGEPDADEFTRTGYKEGVFRNAGRVHFSSRDEILDIFKDFDGILVQERTITQEAAGREYVWAVWDIVMRRAA